MFNSMNFVLFFSAVDREVNADFLHYEGQEVMSYYFRMVVVLDAKREYENATEGAAGKPTRARRTCVAFQLSIRPPTPPGRQQASEIVYRKIISDHK